MALRDRHDDFQWGVIAKNVERDDVADAVAIQADLKLTAVLHRLAVDRYHQIARTQSDARRRSTGPDVGQHHAVIASELEASRQHGRDRLHPHADFAPPNAAALSDLLVDGSNDVARRRDCLLYTSDAADERSSV